MIRPMQGNGTAGSRRRSMIDRQVHALPAAAPGAAPGTTLALDEAFMHCPRTSAAPGLAWDDRGSTSIYRSII
jgi:hypothetical protein